MQYQVKLKGFGFTTTYDTLKEAKAEVKRLISKVPQHKDNIYIDQYDNGATGTWYRFDPITEKYVRNTL